MQKLKNKQLILNLTVSVSKIFLKFCYFSLMLVLLSCRSDTSKKENTLEIAPIENESNLTETNTTKTMTLTIWMCIWVWMTHIQIWMWIWV